MLSIIARSLIIGLVITVVAHDGRLDAERALIMAGFALAFLLADVLRRRRERTTPPGSGV